MYLSSANKSFVYNRSLVSFTHNLGIPEKETEACQANLYQMKFLQKFLVTSGKRPPIQIWRIYIKRLITPTLIIIIKFLSISHPDHSKSLLKKVILFARYVFSPKKAFMTIRCGMSYVKKFSVAILFCLEQTNWLKRDASELTNAKGHQQTKNHLQLKYQINIYFNSFSPTNWCWSNADKDQLKSVLTTHSQHPI